MFNDGDCDSGGGGVIRLFLVHRPGYCGGSGESHHCQGCHSNSDRIWKGIVLYDVYYMYLKMSLLCAFVFISLFIFSLPPPHPPFSEAFLYR